MQLRRDDINAENKPTRDKGWKVYSMEAQNKYLSQTQS